MILGGEEMEVRSQMELFDKKFVNFMWDDSLEGKEGFFADYIDTLVERVNSNIRGTIDAHKVFGTCSCGVDSFPFAMNSTHYRFFYHDPNYSCKRAYMEGKVIQIRHTPESEWVDLKREEPKWHSCYEYRVKPELQPTDEHVCITCIHRCPLSEPNEPCKSCWHVDGLPMWKLDETVKVCGTCKYKDLPWSCSPCNECIHADNSDEKPMWKQREPKKPRKTNRELAKWIAQGNGQVKDINSSTITSQGLIYDDGDDDKPCPDWLVIRGFDETEWHEPEVEE